MENWASAKRLTKDFRLLMLLLDSGKEHGMNLVAVQVNRLGAEDGNLSSIGVFRLSAMYVYC